MHIYVELQGIAMICIAKVCNNSVNSDDGLSIVNMEYKQQLKLKRDKIEMFAFLFS